VTVSHSILAIIAFAEITISVTHCVYCCVVICGPFQNEDPPMVSLCMCNAYCSINITSDKSSFSCL